MDLYIDDTGTYYAPGQGNATLALDPDGDLWAVPGIIRDDPVITETATGLAPALFEEWAGTTGDVVDGVLRVKGPLVSAMITAGDGSGVSFARTLTSSQYGFIDLGRFVAWAGGAGDWTPTQTRVLLDYPAAGVLRVVPDSDGVRLTLAGEGTTSATSLSLRARRYWL